MSHNTNKRSKNVLFQEGIEYSDKDFEHIKNDPKFKERKTALEYCFEKQKSKNNLNLDEIPGKIGLEETGQCYSRFSELINIEMLDGFTRQYPSMQLDIPKEEGHPDILIKFKNNQKVALDVKYITVKGSSLRAELLKPIMFSNLTVIRLPNIRLTITSIISKIFEEETGQYYRWLDKKAITKEDLFIPIIDISELYEYVVDMPLQELVATVFIDGLYDPYGWTIHEGNEIIYPVQKGPARIIKSINTEVPTYLFNLYKQMPGVIITNHFLKPINKPTSDDNYRKNKEGIFTEEDYYISQLASQENCLFVPNPLAYNKKLIEELTKDFQDYGFKIFEEKEHRAFRKK